MTKFEELVNDFTIMGDDGAVIFSSYDQFLEFIEEIVVDERKREREACAKVCENIERNGAWVGLTDDEMQEAGRYSYCRGGTSEKLYHIMWNSQPSASVGWCRAELIAFAQTIEAKLKEKNA